MRKEWWADNKVLRQTEYQESNTIVIHGSFSMSTKGWFPSGCIISLLDIHIPANRLDVVFWDAGQQIINLIVKCIFVGDIIKASLNISWSIAHYNVQLGVITLNLAIISRSDIHSYDNNDFAAVGDNIMLAVFSLLLVSGP